ncbi:MAG: 30S ribosomal protein S16 [Simkania sp.]|nr:30S ribosomal protein S16 [Simkania sp.]
MALIIRLRQQGRTNRQTYRVVVADERSPRDGKYIEMLGWYNPNQTENNVQIDSDRLNYWLGQGAQISEKVEQLATKAAPKVVTDLRARRQVKQVKMAAKRRALKKKVDAVKPAPAKKATAAKKK